MIEIFLNAKIENQWVNLDKIALNQTPQIGETLAINVKGKDCHLKITDIVHNTNQNENKCSILDVYAVDVPDFLNQKI